MKLPERLSQRRVSVGEKFANDIITKINNGNWKAGDALPPTTTLAENYGISLVTAHKSLQGLVESGYLERKSGRGTFVSDLSDIKPPAGARTLPRGGSIGLPVYLQPNPVHLSLVEEISNQASDFGFDLRMGQGQEEVLFIKKLAEKNVRFILRSPYELANEHAVMKALEKYNMTAVNINNFWNDSMEFPQVLTDVKLGVRMIVEELKKLGHERIALVDESNVFPRVDVFDAFCKALMWNDLGFHVDRVKYVMNYGRGWEEAVLKELEGKCTAVIFSYDYHGVAFMKILKEKGLIPGQDLSVASMDNILMAEQVGLTSLAHPMHEIVKAAFKLITGEIQFENEPLKFSPKLIVRESTGRLLK